MRRNSGSTLILDHDRPDLISSTGADDCGIDLHDLKNGSPASLRSWKLPADRKYRQFHRIWKKFYILIKAVETTKIDGF